MLGSEGKFVDAGVAWLSFLNLCVGAGRGLLGELWFALFWELCSPTMLSGYSCAEDADSDAGDGG